MKEIKNKKIRWKAAIPNSLTFGNLICGLLAIQYIVTGDLRNATILIFIALMLDAIDGRVARILGVSNDLGKQLDSLADIVSFGVAPAYLVGYTYFNDFGKLGLLLGALFALFGAYRLARFNITSNDETLKHFKGIPITLAAGIVVFLVLFREYIHLFVFIVIYLTLCLLMVSVVKIPSFKKVGLPKNVVIVTIFLIYTSYTVYKTGLKEVHLVYVAFVLYIAFIIIRYIKIKKKSRG